MQRKLREIMVIFAQDGFGLQMVQNSSAQF